MKNKNEQKKKKREKDEGNEKRYMYLRFFQDVQRISVYIKKIVRILIWF